MDQNVLLWKRKRTKFVCWQLFKPFATIKYGKMSKIRQISVQILALPVLVH